LQSDIKNKGNEMLIITDKTYINVLSVMLGKITHAIAKITLPKITIKKDLLFLYILFANIVIKIFITLTIATTKVIV